MRNLKSVVLRGNLITTLPEVFIDTNSSSLLDVYLAGNPLLCSCENAWMGKQSWGKAVAVVKDFNDSTCAHVTLSSRIVSLKNATDGHGFLCKYTNQCLRKNDCYSCPKGCQCWRSSDAVLFQPGQNVLKCVNPTLETLDELQLLQYLPGAEFHLTGVFSTKDGVVNGTINRFECDCAQKASSYQTWIRSKKSTIYDYDKIVCKNAILGDIQLARLEEMCSVFPSLAFAINGSTTAPTMPTTSTPSLTTILSSTTTSLLTTTTLTSLTPSRSPTTLASTLNTQTNFASKASPITLELSDVIPDVTTDTIQIEFIRGKKEKQNPTSPIEEFEIVSHPNSSTTSPIEEIEIVQHQNPSSALQTSTTTSTTTTKDIIQIEFKREKEEKQYPTASPIEEIQIVQYPTTSPIKEIEIVQHQNPPSASQTSTTTSTTMLTSVSTSTLPIIVASTTTTIFTGDGFDEEYIDDEVKHEAEEKEHESVFISTSNHPTPTSPSSIESSAMPTTPNSCSSTTGSSTTVRWKVSNMRPENAVKTSKDRWFIVPINVTILNVCDDDRSQRVSLFLSLDQEVNALFGGIKTSVKHFYKTSVEVEVEVEDIKNV